MGNPVTRREMIQLGAAAAIGTCCGRGASCAIGAEEDPLADLEDQRRFIKEARFYEKLPNLRVQCTLCPRECRVADRERGFCGVRENRAGVYYTLVPSRPCSVGRADPIEKKPLYHYLPGTTAFSIATAGCNMECQFCQNWQISQFRPEQVRSSYMPPADVIGLSKHQGAPTVAYTYSEPTVFYEYMYDSAKVGRRHGVGGAMISNGYITEPALIKLCEQLTVVKIDFKAFTNRFYQQVCAGTLEPVLNTLKTLKRIQMWFEIVVLVIPTLNDGRKEIREMCAWVMRELGPDVPIHFSRFHPTYRLKNLPPTPVKTVEMARDLAMRAGLRYAYVGNVRNHPGEHTYCPKCKRMVIQRVGYYTRAAGLKNGKCRKCGCPIAGVWAREDALKPRPKFKPQPKA